MSIFLECKKLKRTGFFLAFLGGGLLAAIVPIGNMMFRSEIFVSRPEPALQILMSANWQMMAMLNIFLVIIGACIMYHTEYADNAIQKIDTLPIRQSSSFISKFLLLSAATIGVFIIEAASLTFCVYHWFLISDEFITEILKVMGYAIALTIPTLMLMTGIASVCKNMWVSLGIGVICMFVATIIPPTNFILSLFPLSLPFQMLCGTEYTTAVHFLYAACIETVIFEIAELIYLRVRRSFE